MIHGSVFFTIRTYCSMMAWIGAIAAYLLPVIYNVWFWLAAFVIYLLINNYLVKEPWRRLPPGPPALPLLGSLPFLGADLREPFKKLAAKHGDIFTVYLGAQRAIVLNGYETMKEAFVKKSGQFNGRPSNVYVDDVAKRYGVTSAQGARWNDQRRYTQQVLHHFGFGRSILEERLMVEAELLIQGLQQHLDTPYFPQPLLQAAAANIIGYVMTGKRRNYDEPEMVKMLECLEVTYKLAINTNVLSMLPILRYLPGDIFGYHKLIRLNESMYEGYQCVIDEQKASNGTNTACFVSEYLGKIKEERNNPDTFFTERQLRCIMNDVYLAGSETSSNTLTWAILFLSLNQEAQDRVHAEIDDVIRDGDVPTMKHLTLMPYVDACICEVQRLTDILPFGFVHCPEEDVEFGGYHIPKGTTILPFMHSINFDPKLWPQPNEFRPERFIGEDGRTKKPEELIPFFFGKRVCLGEALGRMEIFLFFTTLLKHFRFRLAPGQPKPDTRGVVGVTNQPPSFQAIIEART